MLSVQPVDNNCSGSGKTSSGEDGVQKAALKAMMLEVIHQELEPILETMCRKVVKEELRSQKIQLNRNPENKVRASELRHLELMFLTNVSLPVLTGEEIKGKGPTSIKVALVDHRSKKVIKSCPEAFAKVEIVALEGDLGDAEAGKWTSEEFSKKIVKEREGILTKNKKKRDREEVKPLLTGNVFLHLNKGIGFVNNIKFRQYSKWMKNSEFKLGARIVDTFSGIRIKEAVTEPFIVKDRRSKCNRKCQPPSLSDDVCKLKNIRKGGTLYKRLREKKVNTVQDFLIHLLKDPEGLEHMLGLEANLWDATVNHAKKCMPGHEFLPCLSATGGFLDSPIPDGPSGHNIEVPEVDVEYLKTELDSSMQGIPVPDGPTSHENEVPEMDVQFLNTRIDSSLQGKFPVPPDGSSVHDIEVPEMDVEYLKTLSGMDIEYMKMQLDGSLQGNPPKPDGPCGPDFDAPKKDVETMNRQLDVSLQEQFSSVGSLRHSYVAENFDPFSVNDESTVKLTEDLLSSSWWRF